MSTRRVTLATCALNQWALDFDGNRERILESMRVWFGSFGLASDPLPHPKGIRRARAAGAAYRLGPELEICGYGCNDHFYEHDTYAHSLEVLAALLAAPDARGAMVVDVGLPVLHRGVRYNCRAFFRDGVLLLLRPKMALADDGNYREGRWFTAWAKPRAVEDFVLPPVLRRVTGQLSCPFGDGVLDFPGMALAAETCEEVRACMRSLACACLVRTHAPNATASSSRPTARTSTSASPASRSLATAAAATTSCASCTRASTSSATPPASPAASMWVPGGRCIKCTHCLTRVRVRSPLPATQLYANHQGCDGERVYYDGCALIAVNGAVVAQGKQFSLNDVEVVTATVDLDAVASYRAAIMSRSRQVCRHCGASTIHAFYPLDSRRHRAPGRGRARLPARAGRG
jgi:NAD+ synthase (glutamine-hydrolysing)